MYARASDPVPLNVQGTDPYAALSRSNVRRARMFTAVMWAASRYDCAGTIPTDAFRGFAVNFQNQVARAAGLLNKLASGNLLAGRDVQGKISSSGTAGAPRVIPLNPVDTNPRPKPSPRQPGPFDTPQWGDSQVEWPGICHPGGALLAWVQQHPVLSLGALGLVALAGGAAAQTRRRRR